MLADPSPKEWRRSLPVLVTDAHTMGALAVIRSLGRAGYPVHACSPRPDALGLGSAYAQARVVCPANDAQLLSWVRDYVAGNHIRAIIPSEHVLTVLRPVYEEFAHLCPFSRSAATLYAGLSKFDLFQRLQSEPQLSVHLPPTLLIADTAVLPSLEELKELGMPVFIKSDTGYACSAAGAATYKASSPEEALRLLRELRPQFKRLVVQGYVPGSGVGAFFLLWNGAVRAEFMHRRLHEVPHTGGTSSLRESWWHDEIRQDALKKLSAMQWQGVAMVEYRWHEPSGQFYLMEMNGRFWGSLHLALYAGVDFPRLLLDSFHGHAPDAIPEFPRGLRCRHTYPMEVQYVWSRLSDRGLPFFRRIAPMGEFLALSLDPRIYSDLFFPGDRRLYFSNLKKFLATFWRRNPRPEAGWEPVSTPKVGEAR
jgi:predicted ATP-grasp superfamily ATP-dependent carboligase